MTANEPGVCEVALIIFLHKFEIMKITATQLEEILGSLRNTKWPNARPLADVRVFKHGTCQCGNVARILASGCWAQLNLMSIKILNNWKKKRHFSNGLWYRKGIMFPWENRKYLHVGVFGFLFLIQWGRFN